MPSQRGPVVSNGAEDRARGGDNPSNKIFRQYPIGYIPIDISEVRTEQGKLQLFVAIDGT